MKIEPKTPYLTNKAQWNMGLDLTFVRKQFDQLEVPIVESGINSPSAAAMEKSAEYTPPTLNSPPEASLRFTRQKSTLQSL